MTDLRSLTAVERTIAALCAALLAAAAIAIAAGPEPARGVRSSRAALPEGDGRVSAPTAPPGPTVDEASVGAVSTVRTVEVRAEPRIDAPVVGRLREGILLPVSEVMEGFFHVLTPCETRGWIPASHVDVHPVASGEPSAFHEATIVLDPGHGGIMPGAVGPTGFSETEANSAIVRELARLLSGPRDIDPETGAVVPGGTYGPPRVFLTRSDEYTAGLTFRTAIASGLEAHAFVSVHNNASPDGRRDGPGTETFYQIEDTDSKRLTGLMYEEVHRTLERYDVPWVGNVDAGAKYRRNSEGGDYYGILRMSDVPTALVEVMFISNGPEEQLLRSDETQRLLAEAIYRGLVRYLTTDDPGGGFVEPLPRSAGSSGRLHSDCTDPA